MTDYDYDRDLLAEIQLLADLVELAGAGARQVIGQDLDQALGLTEDALPHPGPAPLPAVKRFT